MAAGRDPGSVGATIAAEAANIGFESRFLDRPLNVDLSGGEKKRNETVQLATVRPRIAILDEIDSGLDIDALRDVSRRIEQLTDEGLGVLAITHYRRLFTELRPDVVHVLVAGPDRTQRRARDRRAARGIRLRHGGVTRSERAEPARGMAQTVPERSPRRDECAPGAKSTDRDHVQCRRESADRTGGPTGCARSVCGS